MRSAWLKIVLFFLCLTAQAQVNPHTQIRWPTNCNNDPHMAYNWQNNTCVKVGPVGNSGEVQMNQGGNWISAPGFTYDFVNNILTAPNIAIPGNANITLQPANVKWPTSCASGVYSPAGNTCVPPGTAANPAPPIGTGQMNAGGFFGAIPGFTADTINGFITAGGLRYAQGYQTGSGNNGIANGAALNQTVIVPPTYPWTEQYGVATPMTNMPNNFNSWDARAGHHLFFMHNADPAYNPYGDTSHPDYLIFAQHDGAPKWPGESYQEALSTTLFSSTPGADFDFTPAGPVGWQLSYAHRAHQYVAGSGIAETILCELLKSGGGDSVCGYFYMASQGGFGGESDEGKKAIASTTAEWQAVYTGKCTGGNCLTGTRQVTTVCQPATGGCDVNNPGQGTERYLIDTTQGPAANTITNVAVGLNTINYQNATVPMSAVTVGTPVPVSNGWGTLQGAVSPANKQWCYLSSSSLTSAANASGGNTVYTGTITNGAPITGATTATASSGTNTLTVANTTGMAYGMSIAGAGIPAGATIGVISGASVPISVNTTASLSNTPITFTDNGGLVGCAVAITGFGNGANNGSYTVSASTANSLTVNNTAGVAQSGAGTSAVYPFATLVTFNITLAGGTGFDTAHSMCFTSLYHECVTPFSAVNQGGGSWQIKAPVRRGQMSGSMVFQGVGYGLEAPAYSYVAIAGDKYVGTNYRYLIDCPGATTATTLQCFFWSAGKPLSLNNSQAFNANGALYACANYNLTNSGTTVTATFVSQCSGAGITGGDYNGATFYISASTASGIPNNNCTSVTWTSTTAFTCTSSTATGSSSGTGTMQLSKAGMNGLSQINLWQITMVTDVQNYNTVPASMDGTLTIDQNPSMTIAANDILEEVHGTADSYRGMTINDAPITPYQGGSSGLQINFSSGIASAGTTGGISGITGNAAISLILGSAATNFYRGLGGYNIPPNGMAFQGEYNEAFIFNTGPQNGQAVTQVLYDSKQLNDVNYCHYQWNLFQKVGLVNMQLCPNSGNTTFNNTSGGFTKYLSNGAIIMDSAAGVTIGAVGHTVNFPQGSTVNLPSTVPVLQNYVKNAATLTGAGWATAGGAVVTGGQTDPFGGTNAISIATTTGSDTYTNTGSPVANGTTYAVCGYLKGAVGGERESIGVGGGGFNPSNLTTSWTYFNVTIVAGASTTQTIRFTPLIAQTIYVYGWNVVPATSICQSPGLPTGGTPINSPLAALVMPMAYNYASQTAVNCATSGTAVFAMPEQGTADKKVLVHLAACVGAVSFTFPMPFTNTPGIFASSTVASTLVTSLTTTAATITGSTSTGTIVLEEF